MRVLVAPDGFGGTLTAREVALAVAEGWRRSRPRDALELLPLSDGGEGLLDVVGAATDRCVEVEVAGPLGHPRWARLLVRADGTAIVESAEACGLHLVASGQRAPLRATTYGVGQLVGAAVREGAHRVLVGLGGSASVDGGAGALAALGFQLTVEDGSGLKIGGGELPRLAAIRPRWFEGLGDARVELLADVTTPLVSAAGTFGPQKGATGADLERLVTGLDHFAAVVERDLGVDGSVRNRAGTGAAGGLGYGLAAALHAPLLDGGAAVARLLDLGRALEHCDLVVTGEGRVDPTSLEGKVVGHVLDRARARGLPCAAVVGVDELGGGDAAAGMALDVEAASPRGPGSRPAAEVAAAAARLAARRSGP